MSTTSKIFATGLISWTIACGVQARAEGEPDAATKPRPLAADKLSGKWSGEQDRFKVTVSFDGKQATWTVRQDYPAGGAEQKEADHIQLADNPFGVVDLNKVFKATDDKGQAADKPETVRIGWLQGIGDGSMKITVLPVKGYPSVQALVLRPVKAQQ